MSNPMLPDSQQRQLYSNDQTPPVKIFQGISPENGLKTLQEAVTAIFERAEELHLRSRKWSLAELQLDYDDYIWLCDWTHSLSGKTAELWLVERPWQMLSIGNRECPYATAMGILLLLFTTETARRKATEGNLWSIFQLDCFHKSTTHVLFTGGQPTRTYKDALERGARWLNLRHVFGIEGLQQWFDSVYLQFGFTFRGFHRRLPEWLVGQGGTQAIQHLLEGPLRSDSFRTLWDALRNFRRKNLRAEQLKSRLANNPWILPEWIEDLLTQATARIEIGAGAETDREELVDEVVPFVTEPILRWDSPHAPQFLCYITNLAQFELTEPTYYVMINGQEYTQLERSADGIYTLYPSEEIILPSTFPILVTTLISSTGLVIASNPLSLWDNNDGVTVFRVPSGKRIDAWQDMMHSEAAYCIITVPEITLEPQPSYWHKLDSQGTMLSLLQPGWSSSVSVQLEGQLFWQPNCNDLPKRVEPRWTQSVDISLSESSNQVSFGDEVQVIIHHPENVSLSFVRLGTKPIDFIEQSAASALTELITITPDMLFHSSHLAELSFTIGTRTDTSSVRITRALRIEVIGAAMLSPQGWIALQPEMTLTVEQARTLPIQVFRSHIKEWAIMEGDSWIGRPHVTPHPIGSVGGLGAPLRLRRGPYNAIKPDIPLAREVVNRGIIADMKPRHEYDATTYDIHLTYPIELSEQHEVVIWDDSGHFHIADPDYTLVQLRQTSTWVLELPETAVRPLVIAIAYKGVRLGAWWEHDWTSLLQQNMQDVKTMATMLRWFQLPILSNLSRTQVQQFAQRSASTILPIWLSDAPLDSHLQWAGEDDQWLSAVRTLFNRWHPNDMTARLLVTQLGGQDEHLEELILRTAWRLMRVDPLLMGKVLQLFVPKVYLPQFGSNATSKLFHALLSTMTETSNENDRQQKKSDLMKATSDTMGYVDLNFIRRGLIDPAITAFNRKTIEPIQENNIALALRIEPFRRLLGISILEGIEQSIAARR